jgi:DNA segregation ATPase FtsK/SpoIIIE, S-DNA-T family
MAEARKNKLKVSPSVEETILKIEHPEPETEQAEAEVRKIKRPKKSDAKRQDSAEENTTNIFQQIKTYFQQAIDFYRTDKVQRVVGLLLMLVGVGFFLSLTSYFFTWDIDQDKVMGPMNEFFSKDVSVENWFGKTGALVSHLFMHKWFGVSSFFIVPLLMGEGFRKLLARDIPFLRQLKRRMIFFLVWTSLTFGIFFSAEKVWMGGGFGYVLDQELSAVIGFAGLVALLGVSFLIFLVVAFNFSFQFKKSDDTIISEAVSDDSQDPTLNANQNKVVPLVPEVNSVSTTIDEPELTEEEKLELLNFEVKRNDQSPTAEVTPEDNIIEFTPPVKEVITEVNHTKEIPVVKNAGEVTVTVEETKEVEVLLRDEDIEMKAKKLVEEFGEFDPTLELGNYQFPTLDLLNDYGKAEVKISQEEFAANNDKIVSTLKNYGIEIEKIKVTPGPTVTLYEIVPAAGVRISKIKNLEDDIALSLSALGIRIIAPIPGKGTIGIEVPNLHPEMVPMKNILASEKFQNSNFDLPVALGKTISNETFIADLAKMPHLLMAGATGQGKSVGLNAVLVSLLYKKHPAQIKFVLVDPKKVELTLFNKIERHFLAKLPNSEEAIITDTTKVVHTLNSLCIEMDNRYELLKDAQVKNIKEYNPKFMSRKLNPELGHKYLPYIVVVIDEFADLIMTAGKEVEMPIARIAQLARAVGIHLIIATQRPSVNIITGTIKANFPARIAFRVTSKIDSRTILDTGGADQLIGRGDMLLSTGSDLIRLQCAFVDTPEVERITEFIGSQRGYSDAHLLPEFIDENAEVKEIDLSERDKMFDEAARIVVQHQQGSASLLQRKLKLGYNRAGRIVDQLEAAGIIGKFEGSKAREVLIKDIISLEQFLNNLNSGGEK